MLQFPSYLGALYRVLGCGWKSGGEFLLRESVVLCSSICFDVLPGSGKEIKPFIFEVSRVEINPH
jgi:hypothetical protein